MVKIIFLISISLSILLSKEISFDEAYELFLKNNKELKSKKLTILEAKEMLNEISANDYGKLNFQENYMKTNHAGYVLNSKLSSRNVTANDFIPININYPKSIDNFETKLTYDIPLFTGFEISNAKDIANLQIKANEVKFKYDEKLLSLELIKAYNATVAAKEYLKAVEKAKKVTSSFVKYAKGMFEEGFVTKLDLDQAKLHDLKTNSTLKEAKNKVALALSYLSFLVSAEIEDVKTFKDLQIDEKNLEELQSEAITKREDFQFVDLNLQSLEKNIDIKKSDYLPKIGAHLEYGYNNDTLSELNSDKDFYMAVVGLNFKIFDFTREAKIEQSRIKYNKLKIEKEQFKDGIKLEVKENYLNYNLKKEVLEEKLKALTLAEEILQKSEEMYKNNLIKMIDLISQEANLQRARAEAIMSKFELTFTKAKLKLSIGKSLKD